ncbi:MAG: S8 family serine peptidase [bacterium]|nr:S8 family serine peptidase [bacterium]
MSNRIFLNRALLGLAAGLLWTAISAAAERAPNLEYHIQTTPPGQPVPVVLFLDYRLTMDEVYPVARTLPMDQRREYVVETLKQRFEEIGGGVMESLEAAQKEGKVTLLRPLWIINAIRVHATPDVIDELDKNRREVIYIAPDPEHPNTLDDIGWGVADMRAVQAWTEYGARGQGVIVGHKDTGTDLDHPGMLGRIWVNSGEDLNSNGVIDPGEADNVDNDGNGYIDDFYGWNFDNNSNDVEDRQSSHHGTRTGSIITANFVPCDTVCVAPDAKLMELSGYLSQGALFESSQYAVEMGAHVISASVSFKYSDCGGTIQDCPNHVAHRWVSEMELAAGIIHANSSGNAGTDNPVPLSFPAPAMCPPPVLIGQPQEGGVTSIVAVNAYNSTGNFDNGAIGPSAWSSEDICVHPLMAFCGSIGVNQYPEEFEDYPYLQGQLPGLLHPDVAAPTNGRSIAYGGGCSSISGTSGATPHVGGALAVIISAFPGITPEETYRLLVTTCVDGGVAGRDSLFGFGKLRVFPACSLGVTDLTRVTGTVTDGATGIEGVRITCDAILPVYTDASGHYALWLPDGTHVVHYKKYTYADDSRVIEASGGSVVQDVTLEEATPVLVIISATYREEPQDVPITFPEIPLETRTEGGFVELSLYSGIYEVIYGELPWRTDTVTLFNNIGPQDVELPLQLSPRALPTGPDQFGHFIYDQYDADTVEYDWIEINPDAGGLAGELLPLSDNSTVIRNLPFSFRFYGQDYTTITISANGFIALGSTSSSVWHSYFIPSTQPPNGLFAPFFDDWEPVSGGGDVFFYSEAGEPYVIVEWYDMYQYFGSGPARFQAILYDPTEVSGNNGEGVAKYQYHTLDGIFEGAVGVENQSGTDGVQYRWQFQCDAHAAPLESGVALMVIADSTLDVAPETPVALPETFTLYPNYPNPFNPVTTFRWSAPRASELRLTLYDVLGRRAAVIFDGFCEAGVHERTFDARALATGIYFARLEAGKFSQTKKLMLLK